ncbi:hypothetical protein MASR2M117_13020 [Paludibacter sp.]
MNEKETCKDFLQVQIEGGRTINRKQKFFNLDVIISIGYSIKSHITTQFRIWATNVLKDYLLKGYVINQRIIHIEKTIENLTEKINEIDFYIKSNQLPAKGVFFDGQVYDEYELFLKLIRSAKSSIILIDNYMYHK